MKIMRQHLKMTSLTFTRGVGQVGALPEPGTTFTLGDVIHHVTHLVLGACALTTRLRTSFLLHRQNARAWNLLHNGGLQVGVQHLILRVFIVEVDRRCDGRRLPAVGRWGCSGRRWRAVLEGIAAETNRRAVVLIDGGGCCGEAAKAGVVDGGCPHWVDVDDLEEASVGWVLQRLRGDHRSRSAGMLRRVSDRRTYKRKWFFVWHLTS